MPRRSDPAAPARSASSPAQDHVQDRRHADDAQATALGRWLLRQHRSLTARHAARLGTTAAEDLASEAILRALSHPPPDGQLGPWLERVSRNLLVDQYRRNGRRQQHAHHHSSPAAVETPEQLAARRQIADRVAALWPGLSAPWQQAIEASLIEEDRVVLARQGQLSPATLRTRLHRALAAVRRSLGVVTGLLPPRLGLDLQPLLAGVLPAAIALQTLAPLAPPPGPKAALGPRPTVTLAQRRAEPPTAVTPTPPPTGTGAAPVSPVSPPAKEPTRSARPVRDRATPTSPTPAGATQRFDFEDDHLTAERQRPDGFELTGPPKRSRHGSLIEIPSSFAAALARSLEDL